MVSIYIYANGILVIHRRCERPSINDIVSSVYRQLAMEADEPTFVQIQII